MLLDAKSLVDLALTPGRHSFTFCELDETRKRELLVFINPCDWCVSSSELVVPMSPCLVIRSTNPFDSYNSKHSVFPFKSFYWDCYEVP